MQFESSCSKRPIPTSQINSVFVIYILLPAHYFSFPYPKWSNEFATSLENPLAAFIEYLKWQVIGTRELQRNSNLSSQATYNLIII